MCFCGERQGNVGLHRAEACLCGMLFYIRSDIRLDYYKFILRPFVIDDIILPGHKANISLIMHQGGTSGNMLMNRDM